MAQIRIDEPRAAILSVHTSPIDQPGTGDSGGMNVYIRSVATRSGGARASTSTCSRGAAAVSTTRRST